MLPASPEWHDWQVLDSEDLKAGAAAAVLRTIAAGTQHLTDKIKYFSYGGVGPDDAAAERIASVLRPRFDLATVAGDRRRSRELQLVTFLEEQYLALDAVAENQAVLFSGPAGSGKTFIAMEIARRETSQGKTGRLLCFNRFLGRRLADDMSDLRGLSVGTLHQELLRITGLSAPAEPDARFWDAELPERAIDTLLERGDELCRDFLVVDEIQDLAKPAYLDVLDLMVVGGLKDGRVLLFGDFERQAIFDTEHGRTLLSTRMPNLMTYKLTQNCRNLPRIGFQVNLMSRLEPGYRHFRRGDDGVDPSLLQYEAGKDQSPQLVNAVQKLRDEGFDLNEVVVLSPVKSGSTAETTTDPWLRQILRPADGRRSKPGVLQYSTIHAFKGLDAPAVIVTDLDSKRVPNLEAVLYVGLTRATDRLFALIEAGTLRAAIGADG